MIELKHQERFDPFVDDNKDKVEGTTEKSEDALGQSICYATCHESIQGRTCVFQVFVIKDYARLLRWDRSGAIVTCKIPLSDSKFFEFFWRFCHLDASERGWDMTMESPSLKDVTDAKDKLLKAEKEVGIDCNSQHFGKISLGEEKDSYIVHRIFSGTQSPFGRGTRGYAAYRKKDGKVRFLKSTWRVVGEGRKPEHEIYATLHAAEVQYIPTVVEYLEVANHVTKTQDTPKSWRTNNVKDLRKFQHYIIVFEELCRPIEKFQSRQQLLTAFANAAEAHHQALDRAMILHRDISAGNILITKNGEGQLGDWELAKHLDDIKKGGSQPERTGTFQFLSARFVSDELNFGHHDRKDDIESFFHTLQWIVLRFVNHGMHPLMLGTKLYNTFD
ncbi:Protein kinase-like domain containing protein, partial [Amanita muscaria]